MSGVFEVNCICLDVFFWLDPPFPLGSDFGFDRDQELKDESGVWGALPRQRALVEDANKRLSKKSAEVDELCIAHAMLKEEAAQARDAMTKAHDDAIKAQEEVAKTHEDLGHSCRE
jgi:hypothetical protein